MNAAATINSVDQVSALPNHITATTYAGAVVEVAKLLPDTPGPITSKKLFVDIENGSKIVYEFYRVRNKDQKIYVIF